MPPRLPAPLARRIDKLARRAHAFHRFAHHPLCAAYDGEVVAFGRRTRICRGCLLVGLGLAAGGLAALALAPPAAVIWSGLGLTAVLGVLSLVARLPKVVSRFALGALLGGGLGGGLEPAMAAATLAALGLMLYRRRGPSRTPCLTCAERDVTPCSGWRTIVRRERAFQRLAGRWLGEQ